MYVHSYDPLSGDISNACICVTCQIIFLILCSTKHPINYSSLIFLLFIAFFPFLNLQRGRTKPSPSPGLKTLFNSLQRGYKSYIQYDMLGALFVAFFSFLLLFLSLSSARLTSPLCVYVVSCLVVSCYIRVIRSGVEWIG